MSEDRNSNLHYLIDTEVYCPPLPKKWRQQDEIAVFVLILGFLFHFITLRQEGAPKCSNNPHRFHPGAPQEDWMRSPGPHFGNRCPCQIASWSSMSLSSAWSPVLRWRDHGNNRCISNNKSTVLRRTGAAAANLRVTWFHQLHCHLKRWMGTLWRPAVWWGRSGEELGKEEEGRRGAKSL